MKKVFKIEPSLSYSGGCSLVAADNAREAKSLFREDPIYNFIFTDYKCKIEEVPDLYCDSKKSKVIFTNIYAE